MSAQPTSSGRNNPRLAAQPADPQMEEDERPLSARLVEAAKAGKPIKPELPPLPDAPAAPPLPSAPVARAAAPSRSVATGPLSAEGEGALATDVSTGRPLTPGSGSGVSSAPAPQLRSMAERRAAAAASRQARTGERPRRRRRWPKVLVGCVLFVAFAVALTAGASFVYLRWFAHDDAADIQGTWYLAGTDTPVTIEDGRIHLTDEVSYPYTLDTRDKTIQFSFANLAGAGSYRFSLDRNQLALVDGTPSEADTLASDAAWMVQAVIALLQGEVLPPAEASQIGLTLLSRTPASTVSGLPAAVSAKPKQDGDAKDDKAKDGKSADKKGADGKGKKGKSSKDASDSSAKDASDKDDVKDASDKDASDGGDDGANPDASSDGSST